MIREHRPRNEGREHRAIRERLRQHKTLMDRFVAQGMNRDEASKKAFEIVTAPKTKSEGGRHANK